MLTSVIAVACPVVVASNIPVCPLCQRACVEASVLDCCYQSFCDVCIRRLIGGASAVACPNCKTANVTAENIKANNKVRQRVAAIANTTAAAATVTATTATATTTAATTLPQQTTVLPPSPSVSSSPSDVNVLVSAVAAASGKRERSDDGDSDTSTKRRALSVDNAR